ncbi:ASCH domain-containing protein [Nonomuraea sp. NPDC050556]|uniref:ASCH domain-containing protein n=1 Tax=Nonomuraea sp. NPDC050556 TaxID=3364369 RepID=UPI0037AC890F
MKVVKAITIKQPWAALIIAGIKDTENRSWETRYRGELLIHAGQKEDARGWARVAELGVALPQELLQFGVILGSVELDDIVREHDSAWANPYQWNWVLSDAQPATRFVEVSGKLGLFAPPLDWRRGFTDVDAPGLMGWSKVRDLAVTGG